MKRTCRFRKSANCLIGITQQSLTRYGVIRRFTFMAMGPKPRPIAVRFAEKVLPPDENGCIIWNGTIASNGYGVMWVNQKNVGAHRIAVELSGRTLFPGCHVDHLCRVPLCVNPAHLEPVTPGENIRRGETFAAANVAKTHCPKGHPLEEGNLDSYAKKKGRRACQICVRQRCREWHWRNREKRLAKMAEYKRFGKERKDAAAA